MKFAALFLVLCCWLASCSENATNSLTKPSNILPEDTFVAVLVDYSIAESITNLNIKSVQPAKFDSVYAFNPLKLRHIRKSQFDSTIYYYAARPAQYRIIYDTVLSHLNTLRLARQKTKTPDPSK